MARVAANDVERVLAAAAKEVIDERKSGNHSSDFEGLVEAFRRASELRDVPFRGVMLPGRKSRVKRLVIRTTVRKSERNSDYVLCLIPRTQAELDSGRRLFQYELEIKTDEGKPTGKFKSYTLPVIPSCTQQWIRADRLKEVA